MKKCGKHVIGTCTAAALTAMLAGSALGQTCVPPATANGPDVIVGIVNGVTNYTAAGAYEALSLGTTSCNIGNVWLNWFANNNQHPVIGGTLYKYSETGVSPNAYGKFEQVGQSWLKHGFFALSNGDCCSGCQSTDGTHLGVRCSDPYTSGRNGSQSGLGPKWQVNAATGAFTYPPANPAWAGSTARRLQVPIAELAPSNTSATAPILSGNAVRYWGEAHYVTPDDAAAGNKFNNASSNAMTVTGSASIWNFALSGATVRTVNAIKQWKLIDPAVTETIIDVNGTTEGRFIVSSKATDLGNGTWHYEYAVYNMCSDRSGGTFEVNIPAGVNVTNIGFHDVDYLNGDGIGNANRSGDAWSNSMGSGKLIWACETEATNQNANAIRWGTTYNFRFDADAAPLVDGDLATIGLFKAGSPALIQGRAVAPSAPPVDCATDLDNSGFADVPDIFAFLSLWFANDIAADWDQLGTVDVPDIFEFLADWFAGCP